MIVIIEGADGTGKTTLLRELQKYGIVGVSTPRNVPDLELFYFELFETFSHGPNVIAMDRSFISDLVYRLEDEQPRGAVNLHQMCDMLRKNSKIIHCVNDNCYVNSMLRGETNITTKERSEFICKTYSIVLEIFNKFHDIPVFEYDYEKDLLKDVLNFIKED